MLFFKQLFLAIFFIANAINIAYASQALKIKPVKMEVFHNSIVYAMDESGQYQMGRVNGKWSETYNIIDKGLSLLDHLAATDSGLFLIGSESHLDSDNSTYYTGLIVLINSNNKTIKEWHHKTNFLHVSSYKNQILLTSFDGIYTLGANGKIQRIKENSNRNKLSLIHDNQGNLITCHPTSPSKNAFFSAGNATCEKEDSWTFEGHWYASTDTSITQPLACGPWLIEPVQKQHKSPISGIIIRNIKNGKIHIKRKVPDAQGFFCINDSEIMFNTSTQAYSLPDMKLGSQYLCHKKESILATKILNNNTICLTSGWHIGELKKSN